MAGADREIASKSRTEHGTARPGLTWESLFNKEVLIIQKHRLDAVHVGKNFGPNRTDVWLAPAELGSTIGLD